MRGRSRHGQGMLDPRASRLEFLGGWSGLLTLVDGQFLCWYRALRVLVVEEVFEVWRRACARDRCWRWQCCMFDEVVCPNARRGYPVVLITTVRCPCERKMMGKVSTLSSFSWSKSIGYDLGCVCAAMLSPPLLTP